MEILYLEHPKWNEFLGRLEEAINARVEETATQRTAAAPPNAPRASSARWRHRRQKNARAFQRERQALRLSFAVRHPRTERWGFHLGT